MLEKLTELLVDELGCEENEVTLEAKIIDDLGADSLAVMQLVMALEDEYDIEVPEDDVTKLKTVNDIVKYIESK